VNVLILSSYKGSAQAQGTCIHFITRPLFVVRICLDHNQLPSWSTTPSWMPTTAYSVYSQLPSILEAVPPTATSGCDRDALIMAIWLTHIVVCVWHVTIHKPTKQLNKLRGWPRAGQPGFEPCQGLLPRHPEQLYEPSRLTYSGYRYSFHRKRP
jgi:hypothetical protein